MGRLCSVLVCDSRLNKSNNENTTLFSLPKDESIRKSRKNIVNNWNANNRNVSYNRTYVIKILVVRFFIRKQPTFPCIFLAFPCANHKNNFFLFKTTYYVTMRITQHSRISNQKQVKNHSKINLSKLVAT